MSNPWAGNKSQHADNKSPWGDTSSSLMEARVEVLRLKSADIWPDRKDERESRKL